MKTNILICNGFDDAVVAYVVKKWNEKSNIPLGRTIIQKICYFIKSMGVPLEYTFDMHHYGPYSQTLYFRMDDMVADNIVIDNKSYGIGKAEKSEYKPGENNDELIDMYSDKLGEFTWAADKVIDLFCQSNHTTLELLSTIHFLHASLTNFYGKSPEKDEVVRKVNEVKKEKFSIEEITKAYDTLKEAGIIVM
jgi:uncharacterized protein YwgA